MSVDLEDVKLRGATDALRVEFRNVCHSIKCKADDMSQTITTAYAPEIEDKLKRLLVIQQEIKDLTNKKPVMAANHPPEFFRKGMEAYSEINKALEQCPGSRLCIVDGLAVIKEIKL